MNRFLVVLLLVVSASLVQAQQPASEAKPGAPISVTDFRTQFTAHAQEQAAGAFRAPVAPEMLPVAGSTHPDAKSGFLGVLYSVLLPGMGELYAGRFDRGIYPCVTEGFLWLGLAGVNLYGAAVRDDARTFAAQAAGVNLAGKSDQFFVDIGNYGSLQEYNAAKLVERSLDRVYSEDPSAGYQWKWNSTTDRNTYKDQRILSDRMFNASGFVVLGMVANRIWSAVQAAASVRGYNKSLQEQSLLPSMRTELYSGVQGIDGIRFVFSRTF